MCQTQPFLLSNDDTKVFCYGSKVPLGLLGHFYANLSFGNTRKIAKVLVSSGGNGGCLLGRKTAMDLGLLNLNCINQVKTVSLRPAISQLLEKFENLFVGLGKLKGVQLKLNIDKSVTPVTQNCRRIPFHVRGKIEKKLAQLSNMDAIEPVDGPTSWVSPVLAVPKGDGDEDIRLVQDMRKANTAIQRSHKPIPTLDELLEKFNGCTVFSKLDLRHGYHQIELHPDSRYITTFSTHVGLFRWKKIGSRCYISL